MYNEAGRPGSTKVNQIRSKSHKPKYMLNSEITHSMSLNIREFQAKYSLTKLGPHPWHSIVSGEGHCPMGLQSGGWGELPVTFSS